MSGCWQSTDQDIDLREGILRAKVFGVILAVFTWKIDWVAFEDDL